jgi:ribosomal protein S18 acetylase RimI-like enzyme
MQLSEQVDVSKLIFRRIADVDDMVLQQFSCGRQQLDDFLHEDAKGYAAHGLTDTTIVFMQEYSNAIGYFSLSADSVRLSNTEKFDLGLPFDASISYYPAVKITKLAISSNFQSRGIGDVLIKLISGIAAETPIAVRLLTVDAVNQKNVISFYEKVGFVESLAASNERKEQRDRETILMIKDLYQ